MTVKYETTERFGGVVSMTVRLTDDNGSAMAVRLFDDPLDSDVDLDAVAEQIAEDTALSDKL